MTANLPLVSVICLCHNHEDYIWESLQSVIDQDYHSIEIIIVDDGSSDNSVSIIEKFLLSHPSTVFIRNEVPNGNCRAFNQGFEVANGKFLIDLATDDILSQQRISIGINAFMSHSSIYGVHYGNALLINPIGNVIGEHVAKKITKLQP